MIVEELYQQQVMQLFIRGERGVMLMKREKKVDGVEESFMNMKT